MNIINCLERNSRIYPDKIAFTEITKNSDGKKIDYRELNRRTDELATFLKEYDMEKERVLIMLPSSIDYIVSFFGIMKAGMIAVPVYPITNSRHRARLETIIKDSEASFIITNSSTKEKLSKKFFDLVEEIVILSMDEIEKSDGNIESEYDFEMNRIAYLQYTSGSTSDAKGVTITYKNVYANEKCIQEAYNMTAEERIVTWLPFYHDMGLVGNILLTVSLGASCFFMDPISFIQNPYLWLHTVSRVRGTLITAPNFAYQMCVNRISDEEKRTLDLESLKFAINGADSVRQSTIDAFIKSFSSVKFRKSSMKPSYGLAENTLLTTTYFPNEEYKSQVLDERKLNDGIIENAKEGLHVVASGHIINDIDVVIANSDNTLLSDRQVGEILISSDCASKGYWKKDEINKEIFQIQIEGKTYFKTGDLGFLDESYLYIVGRKKDMIIIRGKNYYPQDIELTIEDLSSSIMKDASAVFSVEVEEEEKVVAVVEINKELRNKKNDSEISNEQKKEQRRQIISDIYQEVVKKYQIEPYDIVLIQEKSIPKTSSGKIQRQLCKLEYLEDKLKIWERM